MKLKSFFLFLFVSILAHQTYANDKIDGVIKPIFDLLRPIEANEKCHGGTQRFIDAGVGIQKLVKIENDLSLSKEKKEVQLTVLSQELNNTLHQLNLMERVDSKVSRDELLKQVKEKIQHDLNQEINVEVVTFLINILNHSATVKTKGGNFDAGLLLKAGLGASLGKMKTTLGRQRTVVMFHGTLSAGAGVGLTLGEYDLIEVDASKFLHPEGTFGILFGGIGDARMPVSRAVGLAVTDIDMENVHIEEYGLGLHVAKGIGLLPVVVGYLPHENWVHGSYEHIRNQLKLPQAEHRNWLHNLQHWVKEQIAKLDKAFATAFKEQEDKVMEKIFNLVEKLEDNQ